MKPYVKTLLIIVALALFVCFFLLVWLRSRSGKPVAASVPTTSGGPSFDVQVVKPRVARPLFGLLPDEETEGQLARTPSSSTSEGTFLVEIN